MMPTAFDGRRDASPAAAPDPEHAVGTLAAALGRGTAAAVQQRLEEILLDDRELLISLQCQLEQIRRELRLINDDRIVRGLTERSVEVRH